MDGADSGGKSARQCVGAAVWYCGRGAVAFFPHTRRAVASGGQCAGDAAAATADGVNDACARTGGGYRCGGGSDRAGGGGGKCERGARISAGARGDADRACATRVVQYKTLYFYGFNIAEKSALTAMHNSGNVNDRGFVFNEKLDPDYVSRAHQ